MDYQMHILAKYQIVVAQNIYRYNIDKIQIITYNIQTMPMLGKSPQYNIITMLDIWGYDIIRTR